MRYIEKIKAQNWLLWFQYTRTHTKTKITRLTEFGGHVFLVNSSATMMLVAAFGDGLCW